MVGVRGERCDTEGLDLGAKGRGYTKVVDVLGKMSVLRGSCFPLRLSGLAGTTVEMYVR